MKTKHQIQKVYKRKIRFSIFFFLFALCSHISAQVDTTWGLSTPEEQGMSSAILLKMKQHVKAHLPNLKGVLVIKNKHIVYEEYRNSSYTNQLHMNYSCTKSFSSALIGIAIDKGFIKDTHERLIDLLPEYADLLSQGGKDTIKLKHLLTMTSGFQWDEFSYPYGDSRNSHTPMQNSNDWFTYLLGLPLANTPGEVFTYNTGTSNLFAKIIQNTAHMPIDSFAIKYLFTPLNIKSFSWYKIAQNNNIPASGGSGGGLSLSTRDMAKLGYLYLHKGMWNSEQIVSEQWVEESVKPHVNMWFNSDYGYQWWISNVGGYRSFQAVGWGGQYIDVIPELDLVVVLISDDNADHSINNHILADFIVPSTTASNDEYCECDFSTTQNYLTVSNDNYSDLTGSTSINKGLTWDDPYYRIPIGFSFKQCDKSSDSLSIYGGNSISIMDSGNAIVPLFIPFGADLVDRASNTANFQGQSGSLSPISYKLDGTDGSRILKIEWKNVGFFQDILSDNISSDFTNFQVWLYESNNDIEVRYGPNSITNPSSSYGGNPGPYIGTAIMSISSWYIEGLWLRGNATNPTYTARSQNTQSLSVTPPNGTVYKFSNQPSVGISLKGSSLKEFSIYPNPLTTGQLAISFGTNQVREAFVQIYNLQGTQVFSKTFQNSTTATIDLSGYLAGTYIVKAYTSSKSYTEKLILK
jgi:CubicO group peptidase (beta-lactamase class C family)